MPKKYDATVGPRYLPLQEAVDQLVRQYLLYLGKPITSAGVQTLADALLVQLIADIG